MNSATEGEIVYSATKLERSHSLPKRRTGYAPYAIIVVNNVISACKKIVRDVLSVIRNWRASILPAPVRWRTDLLAV